MDISIAILRFILYYYCSSETPGKIGLKITDLGFSWEVVAWHKIALFRFYQPQLWYVRKVMSKRNRSNEE